MSDWDPDLYERFRGERAQPGLDLLGLVLARPDMTVVDLGCGTGELTAQLHRHLQPTSTLGIDSSESMLARAEAHRQPGLRFARQDISQLTGPAQFDLIFSNAALHWLPDHPRRLGTLFGLLRPGGQLAIQLPANHAHVSQQTMLEIAAREPWSSAMMGYRRSSSVLEPARYAELLHEAGFGDQHVRLQVYAHRLASSDEVIRWLRATTLRDYQRRLPAAQFRSFVDELAQALRRRLGPARPYLYTFQRILIWAQKPQPK